MIETQAEPLGQFGLNGVHFGAIGVDGLPGLGCGEFGRSAVLVRGTQKQHFIAARTLEAGEEIGGQLRADKGAKMFDPVDIGQGRGDKVAGHDTSRVEVREDLTGIATFGHGQRRLACNDIGPDCQADRVGDNVRISAGSEGAAAQGAGQVDGETRQVFGA